MKITDNIYLVSEIFESLQGEGNCAGVNSLFIRFQICNLTCSWCDTKYTWTIFSDKYSTRKSLELNQIISDSKQKHVIFTGGEPCLYRLDLLTLSQKKFHVETNGTIIPIEPLKLKLKDGTEVFRNAMDEHIIQDFNWIISPKLSNSKQKIDSEAIDYWSRQNFAVFKFIADGINDLNEIELFIGNYKIDKNRTFIGLQGTTSKSQQRVNLIEEILRRGFHFSPRLHILIWGNKRGI